MFASVVSHLLASPRTGRGILTFLLTLLFLPAGASAQGSGTIVGTVTARESGAPLTGVSIFVAGTNRRASTNREGQFALAVPSGEHVIVAERLGLASVQHTVTVSSGGNTRLDIQLDAAVIDLSNIVVTASREAQDRSEVAASVGVVDQSAIETTLPSHPSEIMGRIAGVYVNTTGGEGHMTAIRQPLSTAPLYLYLEDGIPTRSTGFFNHNALYEINLPQADRIEVMKGPATALYGSDAIGGVINVGTRRPSEDGDASLSLESGEHGYARALATVSGWAGDNGLRADLNLTKTDGWRSGTAYDRQSGTVRWDRVFGGSTFLKTVATFSNIDQATAGTSALSRDDYEANPTANYTPISFRKVRAIRISLALETGLGAGALSLTPFFRFNSMDILPNWSLTFDPAIWETQNKSYGVQAKYGVDIPSANVRVVGGVDLDYSPGSQFEKSIDPTRVAGVFEEFTDGAPIYDYDAIYSQTSPYVQADYTSETVSVSAGVRADFMGYEYTNNLSVVTEGTHRRPADASRAFEDVSPKFGLTFNPTRAFGVFTSYRRGFRVPSQGQLFRQGGGVNTLALQPVKVGSSELGVRGVLSNVFSYEVTGYYMTKTDDILSFQQPDGSSWTVNAGETRHKGLEFQVGARLAQGLRIDAGYSYAMHTYEDWRPSETSDFSGNEQEFAPRETGNVVLEYQAPGLAGSTFSLEWNKLGSYYEDASNENQYEGHDLLNARSLIPLAGRFQVFLRVQNLTDERYAERASFNAFRGEELAPGLPRTFYAGLRVNGGF